MSFLPLAWVLPNHYQPWVAFHSDVLAGVGLLLVWVGILVSGSPSAWPLLATVTLATSLIPAWQAIVGKIHFAGDGWIAVTYLGGFALAQLGGVWSVQAPRCESSTKLLWAGIALAAIASVGVALHQWLGLTGLGVFATDLPQNGRPFANLAQPNMLATVLCLGLVSCLALYEEKRLGRAALACSTVILCFGLAMTQSRTAWIAVATVSVWISLMNRRAALRVTPPIVWTIGFLFAAFAVGFSSISDALLLSGGRSLDEQLASGTRAIHWYSMLDGIGRVPWFGYGWNQVAVAQSHVALDHPVSGEFIEHSHNIVLDLLVWNGVPLGLLLIGVLVWWFWRHITACRDATVVWLLAGIGIVFVHAMLEFPLDYAYLLLPVGLMMGAVDALSPIGRSLVVPRGVTALLATVTFGLFAWVVVEYVEIEANARQLRLESARIGTARIQSEAPNVILLSQLREFLRFARTEAHRDMAPEQLDWMRKVAERYGYPSVLFRYALAAGLNGQPDVARDTLARLCKTQVAERCQEGHDAWSTMARSQYPELSRVDLGTRPEPRRP